MSEIKSDKQFPLNSNAEPVTTNKVLPQKRWSVFLSLLVGAAAVSASLGALLAVSLSSRPLQQGSASPHLPNSQEKLTDIIPATLTQPVNLLILGIDNDDNFDHPRLSTHPTSNEALASNTDTMLLVRFLPQQHQLNVLSIPRDTLITLPGVGVAKIDSTNWRGGIKLAAKSVSNLLEDVPIDRYVRLSRNGFIRLVDTLGGIEVNVPKKMDYVDNAQHLNIHFLPGLQKLNGQHMEEYVRFRHDKLGDIGRVQRQQEVLKAIQRTLLQPETISKLPQILQVAQENIDTDLSLEEMLALSQAAVNNDRERNNFLMVPGRYSRRDEYPKSYWIHNPLATATLLTRYFDVNTNQQAPNLAKEVNPRQLRVAVANATNQPEVAARAIAFLKKQGFTNIHITDHEIDLSAESAKKTQIIAQHGNPEDANAVQRALGLGHVQVAATGDIWSDITVIIGSDFPT